MKKKKSAQARALIILIIILLAVLAAYGAVSFIIKSNENKAAELEASSTISLGGELGEITQVSFGTPDEINTFEKKNGNWYWAEDNEFPFTQSFITRITDEMQDYTAVRDLGMEDELAAYGLDTPAYILRLGDSEGNTYCLEFGSSYSNNTGTYYYAMQEGGTTVYSVETTLPSYLAFGMMDMIITDDFTLPTEENTENIVISGNGRALELDKHSKTNAADGSTTYTWFVITDTDTVNAASYISNSGESAEPYCKELVDSLSAFSFSSCVSYKPAGDELEAYGLADAVQITLTCTSQDSDGNNVNEVISLAVGAALEDGSGYYAMLSGSDEVCVLNAAGAQAALSALTAMGK